MNWKITIWINVILSLIISLLLMLRGLFTGDNLACGIINLVECGFKQWIIQLLIFYVVIFIAIILLIVIFKTTIRKIIERARMPKFKMPKEKPIGKIPELGKDLDLPEDFDKEFKKIKI